MDEVVTEEYHSSSNDDFFVDKITVSQGAERTHQTTPINRITEKDTVKKKRVNDRCNYSDTNEPPVKLEKRQKLHCKTTSAEDHSLVSNPIEDFNHKQDSWLFETNVKENIVKNEENLSVILEFDAAVRVNVICLSSDEEDLPHCSPEPGPSRANQTSAKYSATDNKQLVPYSESAINDQGGLSHCSSPEQGPSFAMHKSAKYTATDSKNVVPRSKSAIPEKHPIDHADYFGVHTNDEVNKSDGQGRVLINIDHPPNEEDIFLAPQLSRVAKAHQIGGVRFLYDNIVQSLEKFSTSEGAGCVLAHSMGLGKTFQICAFTDVFLQHTSARRVLIVAPLNTILNWMSEFDHWLPSAHSEDGCAQPRSFQVHLLNETSKEMNSRLKVISDWTSHGGVLLIGYELFRNLYSQRESILKKRTVKGETALKADSEKEAQDLEQIYRALVNPGPNLIICDEGHRIKNEKTSTSIAFKEVRTRRRIVLTGYPLQNNLLEYWVMIDFVRPNVLGTKAEFKDSFQTPIEKGSCKDSKPSAVKLMKERVFLLQDLLKGFVQRRSPAVLQETLPHKEDMVLLLRMSTFQRQLYTEHMSHLTVNKGPNPLRAYAIGIKIWNHPDVFYKFLKNGTNERIEIEHDETPLVSSAMPCSAQEDPVTPDRSGSSSVETNSIEDLRHIDSIELKAGELKWAEHLFEGYRSCDFETTAKMKVFVTILQESVVIGDKLLVFSQSLSTIDVIEEFLQQRKIPRRGDERWAQNKTYFRIDGATPSMAREQLAREFNSNPNILLFLISTRAGGIGINLTGANRVIVFDASWNPCDDAQAVCRIYRYGQVKPCFIYRLVMDNCLEKKIFDRQIGKQGTADRILEDLNPASHLSIKESATLVSCDDKDPPRRDLSSFLTPDKILQTVVDTCGDFFTEEPFAHAALFLEAKAPKITDEEKKVAKAKFRSDQAVGKFSPKPKASKDRNLALLDKIAKRLKNLRK